MRSALNFRNGHGKLAQLASRKHQTRQGEDNHGEVEGNKGTGSVRWQTNVPGTSMFRVQLAQGPINLLLGKKI